MKIQIAVTNTGLPVFWTDETSSSRYGFGAVSLGSMDGTELTGDDYGPADNVPGTDVAGKRGRTAAQICRDTVLMDRSNAARNQHQPYRTPEEVSTLVRFCSQWPDGPQISGVEIAVDFNAPMHLEGGL